MNPTETAEIAAQAITAYAETGGDESRDMYDDAHRIMEGDNSVSMRLLESLGMLDE